MFIFNKQIFPILCVCFLYDKYFFTSLYAQSRVIYSVLYYPGLWTAWSSVYMHNLDDKYPTRPGFEPRVSSHNRTEWAIGDGHVMLVSVQKHVFVPHWDLQCIICPNLTRRSLTEVIRCLEIRWLIAVLFSDNLSRSQTTFRHMGIHETGSGCTIVKRRIFISPSFLNKWTYT